MVEQFKEKVVTKGKEINEYMEQYNIRAVVEDRAKATEDLTKKDDKRQENSSVLVSKDWSRSAKLIIGVYSPCRLTIFNFITINTNEHKLEPALWSLSFECEKRGKAFASN